MMILRSLIGNREYAVLKIPSSGLGCTRLLNSIQEGFNLGLIYGGLGLFYHSFLSGL